MPDTTSGYRLNRLLRMHRWPRVRREGELVAADSAVGGAHQRRRSPLPMEQIQQLAGELIPEPEGVPLGRKQVPVPTRAAGAATHKVDKMRPRPAVYRPIRPTRRVHLRFATRKYRAMIPRLFRILATIRRTRQPI